MLYLYLALAVIAVGAWSPILIRFYRNWQHRHNPVSLAICLVVSLVMWFAIADIWEISGDVSPEVISFASTSVSIIVAIYANIAFYLAAKKFDQRKGG